MLERWLPVPDFEDCYEISDLGRVRNSKTLRVLKPETSAGYARVTPCRDGVKGRITLHLAVLTAFVGPRPPGCEGRHMDGDTTNNTLGNLAWGTPVENAADKKRHGTQRYGTQWSRAVLDETKVAKIIELEGAATLQEIAGEIGCGVTTVHHVMTGRTWSWCTGRQYAN